MKYGEAPVLASGSMFSCAVRHVIDQDQRADAAMDTPASTRSQRASLG
jgi:hypothetical protein